MNKNFGNYWKSFYTVMVFIAVLSLQSGCKKSSDNGMTSPGPNEVWIQGMAFSPATRTVAVNTTIVWTNKDGVAHTVTSDASLFDSGSIGSNVTYSHQFTTAGTYHYHCTFHQGMTAVIIVQ